jgi:UDPglucose 6-dehydrogenase
MKIVMIGLGTVALADALALGRDNDVILTGPVPDRVDAINAGEYPLSDPCLDTYLRDNPVRIQAMLDARTALEGAQMVFVSAPLSMDPDTNTLRTIELESRIELAAQMLPHVPIVIRSAVPIGFTDAMRARLKGAKLVYAPEFSRDGHALGDVLMPSFLIIGDRGNLGAQVGRLLLSATLVDTIPLRQMGPTEAEALRHLSVLLQTTGVGDNGALGNEAMSGAILALCGGRDDSAAPSGGGRFGQVTMGGQSSVRAQMPSPFCGV